MSSMTKLGFCLVAGLMCSGFVTLGITAWARGGEGVPCVNCIAPAAPIAPAPSIIAPAPPIAP